jgi:hypothetical protein
LTLSDPPGATLGRKAAIQGEPIAMRQLHRSRSALCQLRVVEVAGTLRCWDIAAIQGSLDSHTLLHLPQKPVAIRCAEKSPLGSCLGGVPAGGS